MPGWYFAHAQDDMNLRVLRVFEKGTKKVQGMPQSQAAAHPRPQEEEVTDKTKQAQIEKTYKKP